MLIHDYQYEYATGVQVAFNTYLLKVAPGLSPGPGHCLIVEPLNHDLMFYFVYFETRYAILNWWNS